ncbi:MAG: sensor histidine kinase [Chloroflexi bacterium]|nr:sensor histidine kinase [Chloroflexota bacterium]
MENLSPLRRNIRLARWVVPSAVGVLVFIFELLFIPIIIRIYGLEPHIIAEAIFFGLAGPFVLWLILGWVDSQLTRKEAAEAKLREEEEYLSGIIQASAEAIIGMDPQERIRSWNRGAELTFGYSAQEMVGQTFHRLVPAERMRELDLIARIVQKEGFIRDFRSERLTKEGRLIPVEITRTALRDAQGKISGYVSVVRDISQRVAQEMAVLEERGRIARDIHDGVAQDLAFLLLKADLVKKWMEVDPQEAEGQLKEIKERLRLGIGELRRIVFALRPADLEQMGFWPAVKKLAADFQDMTGVDLDLELRGEGDSLPPPVETTVFRLIQESLNNVAKHASAHKVEVQLAAANGLVEGWVEDDGQGFDPAQALAEAEQRGSWGLAYMKERVEALGGSFDIESKLGQGSVVRWSLPLGGKR